MAANGQGITATWGTAALGEVISISVDGIAADVVEVTPRGQATKNAKVFSAADIDGGSVSMTLLGSAPTSVSVGLTRALSISGPAISWSFASGLYQSLAWSVKVGERQEYSIKFKVC